MRTFAHNATKLAKEEEENSEQRTDCGNLIVVPQMQNVLLALSTTENAFVKMTDDYATEFQQASQFEFNLIKHVNPAQKTADKMYMWGIEPHCETSHDSTKQVFCKLGETFQLFSLDADECWCRAMPNAESRRVNLCVDQLSSRNFWCLKINLSKKLTELEIAKLVLPMLESLARFTCTIDYLHETRMHRNDAIY